MSDALDFLFSLKGIVAIGVGMLILLVILAAVGAYLAERAQFNRERLHALGAAERRRLESIHEGGMAFARRLEAERAVLRRRPRAVSLLGDDMIDPGAAWPVPSPDWDNRPPAPPRDLGMLHRP